MSDLSDVEQYCMKYNKQRIFWQTSLIPRHTILHTTMPVPVKWREVSKNLRCIIFDWQDRLAPQVYILQIKHKSEIFFPNRQNLPNLAI